MVRGARGISERKRNASLHHVGCTREYTIGHAAHTRVRPMQDHGKRVASCSGRTPDGQRYLQARVSCQIEQRIQTELVDLATQQIIQARL